MDQAEPENQVIPWYQSERCIDANLGRHVRLSALVIHQVPNKISPFITGINKNDCLSYHGTATVDRYFIS